MDQIFAVKQESYQVIIQRLLIDCPKAEEVQGLSIGFKEIYRGTNEVRVYLVCVLMMIAWKENIKGI